MPIDLQVQPRTRFSKSFTNHLRRTGKIPGVLYGKQLDHSIPITIDEHRILPILRNHHGSLIEMDISGAGKSQAVINEVQQHPVSYKVLHVAFHQIDMDAAIRLRVHLQLIGEPEQKEMKYQQHISDVEIKCLPADIPETIPVDLSKLKHSKPIKVKDLQVEKSIRILTPPTEVIIAPIH